MKFLIRVDANSSIGTGHLSRCLTIAESILACGDEVVLVVSETGIPWIENRMNLLDIEIIRVETNSLSIDLLKLVDPDFVILDSYNFNADSTKFVTDFFLTLSIIDSHKTDYYSHFYLHPNISDLKFDYIFPKLKQPQIVLSGPEYALIAKEIVEFSKSSRLNFSNSDNILCMLGGASQDRELLRVVKFLNKVPTKFNFSFIGNQKSLQFITSTVEKFKCNQLDFNPDITKYLINSGTVISAAGSSALELLFLGIPSSYLPASSNQLTNLNCIENKNLGLVLTNSLLDPIEDKKINEFIKLIENIEYRNQLIHNSKNIIDGNGSLRFVNVIKDNLQRF